MIVPATPTVESRTAEDTAARALAHTCTQLMSMRSCCSLTLTSMRPGKDTCGRPTLSACGRSQPARQPQRARGRHLDVERGGAVPDREAKPGDRSRGTDRVVEPVERDRVVEFVETEGVVISTGSITRAQLDHPGHGTITRGTARSPGARLDHPGTARSPGMGPLG